MENPSPHVVILGAGPAGAASAITLRAAGVDATILERSAFPRHRPGETLHPGIEPLLEKLGADAVIRNADYLRYTGTWSKWAGDAQFIPFGQDPAGAWRGFQAPRASGS